MMNPHFLDYGTHIFSYMKEIDFEKKMHHEVVLNVYNKMQFLDSMFFKCHTVADFSIGFGAP